MRRIINTLCTGAALLLCVVSFPGCGGDNGMAMVEGNVTLDGAPLQNGAIAFVPDDGESPTAGARIENGTYKTKVPIGFKRVEITATEVIGQRAAYAGQADSPQMDISRSIVPSRYNTKSELTLDVIPGTNIGDFDVKSQ